MNDIIAELRKLYPKFTDEELIEVERELEAYLQIVVRICNRIISDTEEYKTLRSY